MHALVLYHSIWRPTEELAFAIASELGVRAISFERRPELAMYDLVVLGTAGIGLADPRLLTYLLAGGLRGKHLALYSDVWPPVANGAFQAGARLAAELGGAKIYPQWLQVCSGPLGQLGDADRAAARAWAQRLATDFPPPAYPRA